MFAISRRRLGLHVVPFQTGPEYSKLKSDCLQRFETSRPEEPRGLEGRTGTRIWPHLVIRLGGVVETFAGHYACFSRQPFDVVLGKNQNILLVAGL